MTSEERCSRRVPVGVEAYLVTLDVDDAEDIILLRGYDITRDESPCWAFSPQQWARAVPPGRMNTEAMSTHKDKAIAFLNANFSPWTFVGDEPVTIALEALLRDAAEAALAAHECPECPDCTTDIGQP